MAQVILIHRPTPAGEILELNLEKSLEANVIPQKSGVEAIQLMKLLPKIDLIITSFSILGEDTVSKVLEFAKGLPNQPPVIVLGGKKIYEEDDIVVMKSIDAWEDVLAQSAKMLNISTEDVFSRPSPDYHSFPIKFFKSLTTTPCDIFIRVKKANNENQFLKRIHENDTIEQGDVDRYISNGLQLFYIHKFDLVKMTAHISDSYINEVKGSTNEKVVGESFDYSKDLLAEHGFAMASTELIDETMNSINKMLKSTKDQKFSSALKTLLATKGSLFFRLNFMTQMIANRILKIAEWGNVDQESKLAFAIFFHDIFLLEEDDIFIDTDELVVNSKLTEEHAQRLREQAYKASVLVQAHPDLPMGADKIILHHHGHIEGKGFEARINSRIAPLVIVLIIAEELSRKLLFKTEMGHKIVVTELIDQIRTKYPRDQVLRIIDLLEKCFP